MENIPKALSLDDRSLALEFANVWLEIYHDRPNLSIQNLLTMLPNEQSRHEFIELILHGQIIEATYYITKQGCPLKKEERDAMLESIDLEKEN